MDTDELLPNDLSLSLEPSPHGQSMGLPSVAGREIYAIGSRGRSAKNIQTSKLKPHPSTDEHDSTSEGRCCSVSPAVVSRKGKAVKKSQPTLRGSRQKTLSHRRRVAIEDESDDESEMEVVSEEDQEEEPVVKEKGHNYKTNHSKKVISSSESELSTDLSEDDELVAIAAKLNRGARSRENVMNDDVLEDYFSAHSDKTRMTTSDHTLANLSRPKMDEQSMNNALSSTPVRFQLDRQQLYEEYKELYPYWLFQVSNGFNVLLYGVGSKQRLIEDFRKEILSNSCHLVINGFFPGLTIKQVLTKLTTDVFHYTGTFKSPIEQAQYITKELKVKAGNGAIEASKGKAKQSTVAPTTTPIPDKIFLVIHNIDGQMLRSDTAQTALSVLAQSPSVHIIASVDHINAPLLWDQKKLSRFNWLWYDTTTFEPYRDETSYENSLLVQQSGSLALSSLIHVADSLTPNARGVFELLVKYQLEYKSETKGGGVYLGMSFHDCYLKCREKFLVSSDVTLRSQLTEFKDHKLVRSRKGQDGVEYLFIPVDDAVLNQFLEHERE